MSKAEEQNTPPNTPPRPQLRQRDEHGHVIPTPKTSTKNQKSHEDDNVGCPGSSSSCEKKRGSCLSAVNPAHFGFPNGVPCRLSNLIWTDLDISQKEYEERFRADVQMVAMFSHQLNLRISSLYRNINNFTTYTVGKGDDEEKNHVPMHRLVTLPRKQTNSEGDSSDTSSDSGCGEVNWDAKLEEEDPEVLGLTSILKK